MSENANVICIDPGHGGRDPGAMGRRVRESTINLSVGRRLYGLCKLNGLDAFMTRKTDDFISLDYRCDYANEQGATVFISLHCNSSENSAAHGVEVWHHKGSSKGLDLATKVLNAVSLVVNSNRGVRASSALAVLRGTRAPSCLVEMGFISNDEEERLLCSQEYQRSVAGGIFKGLMAYLGQERDAPS